MKTTLLALLLLSAFAFAGAADAASSEGICNGEPVVDWYPCSAGFIVEVCGEETIDHCQMMP